LGRLPVFALLDQVERTDVEPVAARALSVLGAVAHRNPSVLADANGDASELGRLLESHHVAGAA